MRQPGKGKGTVGTEVATPVGADEEASGAMDPTATQAVMAPADGKAHLGDEAEAVRRGEEARPGAVLGEPKRRRASLEE